MLLPPKRPMTLTPDSDEVNSPRYDDFKTDTSSDDSEGRSKARNAPSEILSSTQNVHGDVHTRVLGHRPERQQKQQKFLSMQQHLELLKNNVSDRFYSRLPGIRNYVVDKWYHGKTLPPSIAIGAYTISRGKKKFEVSLWVIFSRPTRPHEQAGVRLLARPTETNTPSENVQYESLLDKDRHKLYSPFSETKSLSEFQAVAKCYFLKVAEAGIFRSRQEHNWVPYSEGFAETLRNVCERLPDRPVKTAAERAYARNNNFVKSMWTPSGPEAHHNTIEMRPTEVGPSLKLREDAEAFYNQSKQEDPMEVCEADKKVRDVKMTRYNLRC
jgi:hypothetical protein